MNGAERTKGLLRGKQAGERVERGRKGRADAGATHANTDSRALALSRLFRLRQAPVSTPSSSTLFYFWPSAVSCATLTGSPFLVHFPLRPIIPSYTFNLSFFSCLTHPRHISHTSLQQHDLLVMIKLGLERALRLCNPIPQPWHAVHVAGTNGKGSICAFITSALTASGLTCGTFTSPHLIDR
jgi:hypothetical protein